MTYYVGLAFLSYEQEDNLTWALEMFVGLLSSKLNMPKVVVTDRDNSDECRCQSSHQYFRFTLLFSNWEEYKS